MQSKLLVLSALGVALAAGGAQQVYSMEPKINGKKVSEIFPDPKLAALATAACDGDEAGVAKVVALGANPNGTGYRGTVPLLWAIRCHNLRGVEALLKAGADPNHMMDGDMSPVYEAAQEPVAILKALLRHGGDPNAVYVEKGRSALMEAMSMAVDNGKWENYYALLDAGADINRVYKPYNTIATFSVVVAQYDKLAELLDRGYNRDLQFLGAYLQGGQLRPELEPKRARVKTMLEGRGVKFPVPPMRPPGT